MPTITLDVPDELYTQLDQMRDRLPELLALSLRQPPLPAQFYRQIIKFLASDPTPEQIDAFQLDPEAENRLETLLDQNKKRRLTDLEKIELEEFDDIDYLISTIKILNLPKLNTHPEG